MPSEAPILAKRRSERVLIAIPVQVSRYAADGTPLRERGETLVVSQHGALLRLPSQLALDTPLEVLNCYSNEAARFRVAYVDAEPKDGHFHVGVEMLTRRDEFWHIEFPSKQSKS